MFRWATALIVVVVVGLLTADDAEHTGGTQEAGDSPDHPEHDDFEFSDFFGEDNLEDDE